MPGPSDATDSQRIATSVLPKRIAAAAFLVYIFTLNHWFSLEGLSIVARASGWSWYPEPGQPLTRALLLPFRILPASWIPLALNIFNAAIAALIVGVLARTVSILPQDILPLQPFKKRQPLAILSAPLSWIPPVLAAIVCGLQLSFWENATSMTGQILDLLLFAWVIRCLIEFRHSRNEKWLLIAAATAGAGMANSWVLLAYFPVFLLSIFGVKGWAILEVRFLLRMTLCGVAGLSLYLVLPLVQTLSPHADASFWLLLKGHLKGQREALALLKRPVMALLAFTAVLPLGLLAIRWRSHTVHPADDPPLGLFLRRATGHAAHLLFFVCTLWVAFDTDFAPRNVAPGLSTLTWYYSSALVFGYCAGYLLLFQLHRPQSSAGKFSLIAARALVFVLPALLLWRNVTEIRSTNGSALHEFASQLYSDLPAGKSVVLSDDPIHVLLLRAETRVHRGEKDPMFLETAFLTSSQFHAAMSRQFPTRWPGGPALGRASGSDRTPTLGGTNLTANRPEASRPIGPAKVINLVAAFVAREPVLYVHPAFGSFFERFGDEPHGFTHVLLPRPAQEPAIPVISQPAAAEGEQRWQSRWNSLQRSSPALQQPSTPLPDTPRSTLHDLLRLPPRPNLTVAFLALAYSRAFDDWGVRVQRLGRATESAVWFERALLANPNNLAARLNLAYNQAAQRGDKSRLNPAVVQRQWADLFSRYKAWREVLINDGPVDEPTYLFRTGRMLLQNGNDRQAASAFSRSIELAPDWRAPKLFLAEACLELGNFETALRLTDQLPSPWSADSPVPLPPAGLPNRAPADTSADSSIFPHDQPLALSPARLLYCRATALLGLARTNDCLACINSCVSRFKDSATILTVAADLYGKAAAYHSQLDLLNDLLQRDPNQTKLLTLQGFAQLQLTNYDAAIAALTKVIGTAPDDQEARLSRAIANLAADHVEPARADYQHVLKNDKTCPDALFGLATIAWREHDTNQAAQLYSQYIAQARPKSPQYALAAERLKSLMP
jgi:tetratricopeptide (TPR) repeat protein